MRRRDRFSVRELFWGLWCIYLYMGRVIRKLAMRKFRYTQFWYAPVRLIYTDFSANKEEEPVNGCNNAQGTNWHVLSSC